MAETAGADELATLRAEAEAAGVKVDGRWGVDRLRSELEAAQPDAEEDPSESMESEPEAESDAAGEEDPSESMESEPEAEPDTVHRAGGWVDRGDGRGWVLEE